MSTECKKPNEAPDRKDDKRTLVSLTCCESYEPEPVRQAMEKLLEPLGGLDFVKPGMTVGIKANLVIFKKPEAAATTHPAVLGELIRRLIDRGARVIVGDSPGGAYNSAYVNRVYSVCGLKSLEEDGARLNQNFDEKDRVFPQGLMAKELHYTAWVDECDVLINVSKLKTHGMMGMSGAAKNMFGLIPGTYKPEYHFRYSHTMDFARMILDINRCFPCQLYVMDGVIGMEGNGPTAGTPRAVGCLLASRDPYALDVIASRIIGLTPENVPTTAVAMEAGLLTENLGDIPVTEPVKPYQVADYQIIRDDERLKEQNGNAALWGKGANAVLSKVLTPRPRVTKTECIGCGECGRVCPAKAITFRGGKPVINRQTCIRCFCCQEFCPKGAMKVYRPVIARIAGRL